MLPLHSTLRRITSAKLQSWFGQSCHIPIPTYVSLFTKQLAFLSGLGIESIHIHSRIEVYGTIYRQTLGPLMFYGVKKPRFHDSFMYTMRMFPLNPWFSLCNV
jgi:hypothetical protein